MKETMYERIKRLRIEKDMSQYDLAIKSGYTSRAAISKIEKGERDIPANKIMSIAAALGVSPSYLMDGEGDLSFVPHIDAPLFASVSAGFGSTQEESIGTFPCVVHSEEEERNTICLLVSGDSMSPDISDGDIIQVRRQTSVDYGDIAVIRVDGEHYVKRVEYGADYIRLVSTNECYEPKVYTGADVLRCNVEGKVIGAFKRF